MVGKCEGLSHDPRLQPSTRSTRISLGRVRGPSMDRRASTIPEKAFVCASSPQWDNFETAGARSPVAMNLSVLWKLT
ncbi:hypothetical protein PsYK624_068270 [Phanerochaete sordida]|uniref:Uncharacterized protein n=1 Tax=Phanerochaete sordida TaxID=48140 RepID=A0A9P3G9B8_9APHY|nr:hypothetical protein PsYK624_068270 [Phanerochaete sordida]